MMKSRLRTACIYLNQISTSHFISLSLSPVRTLKGSFLKVEDMSRAYRPLVLEMKRWPRPLCHTSYKACPFDPPHLIKSLEETKPALPPTGMSCNPLIIVVTVCTVLLCITDYCMFVDGTGVRHGGKQGGGRERGEVREKRPGHCECCCVKFEDLHMVSQYHCHMFITACITAMVRDRVLVQWLASLTSSCTTKHTISFLSLSQHLSSARHQEYANNEDNFKSLDRLIAQGKSFSQFLHELRSTPQTNW